MRDGHTDYKSTFSVDSPVVLKPRAISLGRAIVYIRSQDAFAQKRRTIHSMLPDLTFLDLSLSKINKKTLAYGEGFSPKNSC
jgi:hypothetical protein